MYHLVFKYIIAVQKLYSLSGRKRGRYVWVKKTRRSRSIVSGYFLRRNSKNANPIDAIVSTETMSWDIPVA